MRNALYIICAALFFTSCEKVLNLELDEADKTLVIDAQMYEGQAEFVVKISQTTSYYDNAAEPQISDATVELVNKDGMQYAFENKGNGNYAAIEFLPEPGMSYTLSVTQAGVTYTATATMPKSLPLDSIRYEYEDEPFFGDAGYQIYCEVEDPAGENNYYRVNITLNGDRLDKGEDLFLFDDQYTDGNRIEIPLFNQVFQANDTIIMDMLTMDADVYFYLNGLAELVSGGGGSAAPANPKSNFNNGALGYFGAYTKSSKTVILPQP